MQKFLFCIVLLVSVAAVQAQGLHRVHFEPDETADVSDSTLHHDAIGDDSRLHGSIGLGTGVISGWGHTLGYTFLNPELSYRVSDRLAIGFGMGMTKGFDHSDIHLHTEGRSLAPRKNRKSDYMHLDGAYRVNDRLTVAASVFFGLAESRMVGLSDGYLIGASAAMRYRFGQDNYLSLYIEYIHSENMPLLPYYSGLWPYGYHDFRMMGLSDFGATLFYGE